MLYLLGHEDKVWGLGFRVYDNDVPAFWLLLYLSFHPKPQNGNTNPEPPNSKPSSHQLKALNLKP